MAMPLPLPTFTTDDLRAFPQDGQRYELLEGMLLVTPAPGSAHQVVLSRLLIALGGLKCFDSCYSLCALPETSAISALKERSLRSTKIISRKQE